MRYKQNSIEIEDFNFDGAKEVKFVTDKLISFFNSSGQMIELSLRDDLYNIQNTLSRKKESYHRDIFAYKPVENIEQNDDEIESIHNIAIDNVDELKSKISYDWYEKYSFVKHITDNSFSLENFAKCTFREYGDFANQKYNVFRTENGVEFIRNGGIYKNIKYPTQIKKTFSQNNDTIGFEYSIDTSLDDLKFVLEFNLHFAERVFVNDSLLDDTLEFKDLNLLSIRDSYLNKNIVIKIDSKFDVCLYELQTVSKNEKGFDLTTQGVSIALIIKNYKSFTGEIEVKCV
jgi:hypothetical protein